VAGFYFPLKYLHLTTVGLSFTLFFLRGIWMLRDSAYRQQRWVKILPHVIDTLLLLSAIALTLIIHQYPFVNDWLTAKVITLLVYIGLGTVALKRGKNRKVRAAAWVAALLTFGYIVAVALYHDPLPF
jgi:uncharacterized membrane protein SirB2